MKRSKSTTITPTVQKSKPNKEKQSSFKVWLYVVCGLFAFLLYCNTLNHEYAYDDFPTIYGNQITMQGFKGIPELLHTSYWFGLNGEEDWLYRPLSMVMFAAEWGVAPNKPALGHWINVLLYALTAVILMRFLCNIFQSNNLLLPFVITLIWIAHPLHTEVVANIKSRDEILCFLFCVLTLDNLLQYSKNSKVTILIKGCLFYFLALMSKESAITLLAIIPLAVYFFGNTKLKNNLFVTAIAFAPAALYMLIRSIVLSNVIDITNIPLSDNSLVGAHGNFNLEKGTAFYILGFYLKLLFFPHPLSMDYSFNEIPLVGLSNPVALFALVAFFSAGVYALVRLPKKDPVAFGILFFIITLSIASNVLFLTRCTMAERFLYMPSLGFIIAFLIPTARLLKTDFNPKIHFAGIAQMISFNKRFTYMVCVILSLASIKTIARNSDWKNDTTIFSADALNAPNSSRIHFLNANHLTQEIKQNHVLPNEIENYYRTAIDEYNKCISIDPDHYQSYFGLANVYEQKKQMNEALKYYLTVRERLPNLQLGYSNLGTFYFKIQQYDSAIVNLKKANSLDSTVANVYNSLGSAYFGKGELDNAIFNYQKSISLAPQYGDAWKNLGSCYGTKKEFDKAISAFQKAGSLAPRDADIKRFLEMTIQLKNEAASN